MFFSIIVPTYNSKKFIRNCLDSILSQTFKNFEVIVIDDGSTDNTLNILKEYEKKDSRIFFYHFENAGISVARRRGISLACGDYLIFVDSDDTINPLLLENINNVVKRFPEVDLVRYQCNIVKDKPLKDHQRYNFHNTLNVPISGIDALRMWSIGKKQYAFYWLFAFKKTIFYRFYALPNLRCYEDMALIPLIIATAESVITIDYVGYNYLFNNDCSLTHTISDEFERCRVIDFLTAYHYAIENFIKLKNVTPSDASLFINYYTGHLQKKFDSLSAELQKEFYHQFHV